MSRTDLKNEAKRKLGLHTMPAILLFGLPTLILMFISNQSVYQTLSLARNGYETTYQTNYNFWIWPIILLVDLVLVFISLMFLEYSRSQNVNDLSFARLGEWLTRENTFVYVKTYLLQSLYLILWSLIPIAGIFFVINRAYAYRMTAYLIYDEHITSAKEAIQRSKTLMDGQKFDLFMLDLSFIGWYFLSAITGGIVGFYVTPYTQLAEIEFYEMIH